MEIDIQEDMILGCDQNSRIYSLMFNLLCPVLLSTDEKVQTNGTLPKPEDLADEDLSAMGLYIGKFVEQEINSSIVQLMRQCCGVPIPEYYCRHYIGSGCDCNVETGNGRVVRLNEQATPMNPDSLKGITLGDAYYALLSLRDEVPEFFQNYIFLYKKEFLDAWRKLFVFRNRMAHPGSLVTREDLIKNFKLFNIFVRYMSDIRGLKKLLAPPSLDEVQHQQQYKKQREKHQERAKKAHEERNKKPFAAYADLLLFHKLENEEKWNECNTLMNRFNWFSQVFEGNDGKKGLRGPSGVIIPPMYDDIQYTYDILHCPISAEVCFRKGKAGLVSLDGQATEMTSFCYSELIPIELMPGFFYKKEDDLSWGLMNNCGKELLPCIIDEYNEVVSDTLYFRSGIYYGMWIPKYDLLIKPVYDNIEITDPEEPTLFTLHGVLGYVHLSDGRFISKQEHDSIEDEDERYNAALEYLRDMDE